MQRCAEVSRSVNELCFSADHIDQEKELNGGRINLTMKTLTRSRNGSKCIIHLHVGKVN